MSVRDVLKEISEIKSRRLHSYAFTELEARLRSIEEGFKRLKADDNELVKYFPVAMIAVVESYFRQSIQQLIDVGDPFAAQAAGLAGQVKIDYEMLKAIGGRATTIGELIGHSVKLSRFDQLNSCVSTVIGQSFTRFLESAPDRWEVEINNRKDARILNNAQQVFSSVGALFEARHIICHESAAAFSLDVARTKELMDGCFEFLLASEKAFMYLMDPNAPLTQTEMNFSAYESLRAVEETLEKKIAAIRDQLEASTLQEFNNAQMLWEGFRDAWVMYKVGPEEEGGSIWPLEFCGEMKFLVRDRLSQLSWSRDEI